MKGLLPWLREALFGPPKPKAPPPPRCAHRADTLYANAPRCSSGPNPNCGAGYCSRHHFDDCVIGFTGPATCRDGRERVYDPDGKRIA